MAASIIFLGTGTSVGVPVINCKCAVCRSSDTRNRRTRSSVLWQHDDWFGLVDTGPDLREQALRENMHRVDAVFYTHAHVDHVVGFDELRAFCWHRDEPLPLYASADCLNALQTMFAWAFLPQSNNHGYVRPAPHELDSSIVLKGVQITALWVEHASVKTCGFLFRYAGAKSVAYLPDVKSIPSQTMQQLKDVDILIIDALRPVSHPTHLSTAEALHIIQACGAKEAYLTHLGHDNDHEALSLSLPDSVYVAYDGLKIDLSI